MNTFLRPLLTSLSVVALLVTIVVLEIVVAMFAYTYLALNHVETFGYLIGLSRNVLNFFVDQLSRFAPEVAMRANTTLLGELDPKSILLLLIGLGVSAIGRLAGWAFRR